MKHNSFPQEDFSLLKENSPQITLLEPMLSERNKNSEKVQNK